MVLLEDSEEAGHGEGSGEEEDNGVLGGDSEGEVDVDEGEGELVDHGEDDREMRKIGRGEFKGRSKLEENNSQYFQEQYCTGSPVIFSRSNRYNLQLHPIQSYNRLPFCYHKLHR